MKHPIPILLYHRIDHAGLSTSTPPHVFREHLTWLSENGWHSLCAEEFALIMHSGKPVPKNSFLITFDDGYESVRSAAFPILQEFGFKAINFLATQFMRSPQCAKTQLAVHENQNDYLTWDQVRELQSSGIIDCQSHSHSHSNFTSYSMQELKQDLSASIDLLSIELRLPRSHFKHLAWPWGLSHRGWREAASSIGFQYQYSVSRQACRLNADLNQIPRTCFDAAPFSRFQRQVWLQTGYLAPVWDMAYPLGRKLRRLSGVLRAA